MKAFLCGKIGNNVLGLLLTVVVFAILSTFIVGGVLGGVIAGVVGFSIAAVVKKKLQPTIDEQSDN
jgi:tetrahydromethanopterin S-methyltransferase subunit E